ncbi:ATP synthase F0 subunit C [Candidatus Dependentiae bacterium]
MVTPEILHYLSAGIAICFGSIGAGIGQGIGACSGVGSMSRQPVGNDQIFRTMVIGLAFIESGVLFTLVIALLTLFGTKVVTMPIAIAELGMALAIGVSALAISIASSFAVKSTCKSIARQPFFSQKIVTLMLIAQSMIEAPVVFAFVLVLMVKANLNETISIYEGVKYFSACLCIAIGSIGPSCGQAIFTRYSSRAVGLNKDAYSKIFTFSIINEAIIQTPLIFSLLVSILLIYVSVTNTPFSSSVGFLMAAITTGLGCLGTPIAAGNVGAKGCEELALNPDNYSSLFRSTILAQAFIESSVIYCLIIALFLLTKTF